eukprot:CAMPEP_0170633008 /NCGR_PEP_ID=MMETSP0224-20130122/35688_1 /TAXON_ID=285029 /ORGANISM="Togula jolla, Strain CCCM 725" /LENGTH=159 /DNA_ID=CAMNT_0010961871 /DNA_START=21 /DNA_END=497 /DNA_ORIENTATION=+
MAPMCCNVDPGELSCQHARGEQDESRFLLLLFDFQKGGSGAVDKVHANFEALLEQAVRLLEECPCDDGCPNCIVVTGCGGYNRGLEKQAALMLGHLLGFGRQGEQGSCPEPVLRAEPPKLQSDMCLPEIKAVVPQKQEPAGVGHGRIDASGASAPSPAP